jgi:hypothetical protein
MPCIILKMRWSVIMKKLFLSVALLTGSLAQGSFAFADQTSTNSANGNANSVATLQANTQAAVIAQMHSQVRTLKVILASLQTPHAHPAHANTHFQAAPDTMISRLQNQVQDLLKQVKYQNALDNQQAAEVARTVTKMSHD